jgi:streptomycin 6-kinase
MRASFTNSLTLSETLSKERHVMFADYLLRWKLTPDGEPIITPTSRLLPVKREGALAILKLATHPEEKAGAALMAWWDGSGAARVLARDDDAILLERGKEPQALAELCRNGRDDDASRIICGVVAKLHAPRSKPLPQLRPLSNWFQALTPAAATQGGVLNVCAAVAHDLLVTPREMVALHGDIHHANILDFGARGWLAIDPKGLFGERSFDYANIFCNPDEAVATGTGRLARQAEIVARAADLERRQLLRWVIAYAGLSAAWRIGDGEKPDFALRIAAEAAAELDR